MVVVLLIMEVAHPGGQRFSRALAASIVAGSVSFGIYFAIAGAVLLGVYQVPPYRSRTGSCSLPSLLACSGPW